MLTDENVIIKKIQLKSEKAVKQWKGKKKK
jgi:hypothetical protein